jgi:hypothetical protein
MTDYTKTVDFAAKDGLASGNPAKAAKGTEVDTELDNIAVAIATKYDANDRGAASGIAPLDSGSLVPVANLPIATEVEADGLIDDTVLITPLKLDTAVDTWSGQNAGIVFDLHELASPGADRILFWDNSASGIGELTVSTGLTLSTTNLTADASAINHNSLLNYDSNDHIDHTTVTMTAGTGLSGGGTIAATRTFNLDISGLTAIEINAMASTDGFLVDDGGVMKRMEYTDSGVRFQTVSGTTDTLATADMNTFIEYTNAGAVAVTLNTGVGVQGNIVIIKQGGAGTVTIGGTATVETSIGLTTRDANSVITLFCQGSNVWALYGDTA